MKKFILSMAFVLFLASPAMAANKAKVKAGPVKLTAKDGVIAANQGNFINITIGGANKKGNSVLLSIAIPNDVELTKGTSIGLFDLLGETDDDNPGEASYGFFATKVKTKGSSQTSTSYANAAESVTTGKLKVKSYDPETKVLKFNMTAKSSPYTFNKNAAGNKTSDKKFKTKIQAVVTLP